MVALPQRHDAELGLHALQSGDATWTPSVPELNFPELQAYVDLVATDFRIRGIRLDALNRLDWGDGHLTTDWQECIDHHGSQGL